MSALGYLVTRETRRKHRARWFVYAGGYGQPLTKIPHAATMRGHWPGYDVACSCGWESRTGGATRASVEDALWDHRYSEQCNDSRLAEGGKESDDVVNAKASVLMYAEQDGWTLLADYSGSIDLLRGDVRLFVYFTARGERVGGASCYSPAFRVGPRDRGKLERVLRFIRSGGTDTR